MGRPAASEANKQLSVLFANLITCRSDSRGSTIARCGKCSIYALFKSVIPDAVRDLQTGTRDGVSEVEFNKVLQV